jgi:DNA-binding MarR family transcriptional regulator
MKKNDKQKEFLTKQKQLKTLQKYKEFFVMVKYSDTKLVPKQAKVLGFIRGMIKNNQKNPNMNVFNKVWMKETTKKIAFLLGMGESTIKDHIKHLEEKGYLQRANHTYGLDNTNWYWIDEIRIDKDYTDYLLKLELELNQLSEMCELDSNIPEVTNSKDENKLRYSQNLANENPETSSTILYNNGRILNSTENNIIELLNNEIEEKELYDFNFNGKESTILNNSLDKKHCFNELNNILPDGWYDFLLKNNQEKFVEKYDDYFTHYSDQELHKIFVWMERVLE